MLIPTRGAGGQVDVDLLDLLVFLQAVDAQLAANAGHLIAAPRCFVEGGVEGVDPGDTGADLFDHADGPLQLMGEHTAGQTVIRVVGHRNGFFLGLEGLNILCEAKAATGLPIVTELMSAEYLDVFNEKVDLIQIGARNMQNFELLKALGKLDKPVLLKRGWANTVKELLTSAEYIMSGGNERVVLCERGIRTFETATHNTLDLSAVAVIKDLSRLPVIVDPSHATGHAKFVEPMALAAAAAGADGLMIEVHDDPAQSKCDAAQAVTPAQFAVIAEKISALRKAIF